MLVNFGILKVISFFCLFNPLSNGANCFSIYFPNFNLMWGISTFFLNFFSFVNVHTSLSMVIFFVSIFFDYLWAPSSLVYKFIGQLWNNIHMERVVSTCLIFFWTWNLVTLQGFYMHCVVCICATFWLVFLILYLWLEFGGWVWACGCKRLLLHMGKISFEIGVQLH